MGRHLLLPWVDKLGEDTRHTMTRQVDEALESLQFLASDFYDTQERYVVIEGLSKVDLTMPGTSGHSLLSLAAALRLPLVIERFLRHDVESGLKTAYNVKRAGQHSQSRSIPLIMAYRSGSQSL